MAGFWDKVQSFIPETERTKMYKAENAFRLRALQREEEQANLLRQRQDMAEFATSPSLQASYPEFVAQDQQRNALDRVDPAAALGRLESKLYPAEPEEYTLTPGAKRMRGDQTVAENVVPTEAPKRRTGQFGNRLVDMDTGETIREFPQEGAETWSPLTRDMAESLGLNPTGSYQQNSKGQIQTITQPKQDAPTETQAKFGYNARRVAGSLAKVNEVLAKDPGASSSWALETFSEGPIASRTGMDVLARNKVNPNAQIVRNNMVDAIDAVITLGTGAAYTKEQLEAARATYMPRPGEPADVKQDKFRKLLEVYDQAKTNARTAGEELPDPALFAGLFGIEGDIGVPPRILSGPENDPLGIRGR
jgi:hypothetical protein